MRVGFSGANTQATSFLDQLGAVPPAVVHVPFQGPVGEAEGWVRQLRTRALAVLAGPALSRMR
ncbi:MAG: hypothetical protein ACE5JD_03885 [Candidatus Methylomirabilia bacterium]